MEPTEVEVGESFDAETDSLIEEMLRDAEPASEPGTLRQRDVLRKKEGEVPMPTVVKALTSAGWVYIYDNRTGERSLTNRNMLPDQLKKAREDGSLVFTTRKAGLPKPKRGTLKCLLAPDVPERELYDSMGLPTCPKSNLVNKLHQTRHMKIRHGTSWEAIQQYHAEAEKEEEKTERRAQLELYRRILYQQTSPDVLEAGAPTAYPAPKQMGAHAACEKCDDTFYGRSLKEAQNKVRLHARKHKE